MEVNTTQSEIMIEGLRKEVARLQLWMDREVRLRTRITDLWQRNHTHMAALDAALADIQHLKASQLEA